MAEYKVVRDFYVAEFDVQLQAGQMFADGDAEPDLVAQLLASGVIADVNAPAPVVSSVRSSKRRTGEQSVDAAPDIDEEPQDENAE